MMRIAKQLTALLQHCRMLALKMDHLGKLPVNRFCIITLHIYSIHFTAIFT